MKQPLEHVCRARGNLALASREIEWKHTVSFAALLSKGKDRMKCPCCGRWMMSIAHGQWAKCNNMTKKGPCNTTMRRYGGLLKYN